VTDELVTVRYMADDVEEAVAFYTTHFGFTVRSNYAPAFADVVRGHLRLLLSGPTSSAGRPMPDGRTPEACSRLSVAARAKEQRLRGVTWLLPVGRCPTAARRSPEAGTASTSSSRTSRPRPNGCGRGREGPQRDRQRGRAAGTEISGEQTYIARGSEMKTSDVAIVFPHDLVLIEVVSARLSRKMQVEGDPVLLASALERMVLKKGASWRASSATCSMARRQSRPSTSRGSSASSRSL
jgi:Glyoxalase/Bleomycin resistance protein/Dioxygenase superfamily